MLQSFLVYSITALLLFIFGSVAAKRERINNSIGKSTHFLFYLPKRLPAN
jgi:hypothetical protein